MSRTGPREGLAVLDGYEKRLDGTWQRGIVEDGSYEMVWLDEIHPITIDAAAAALPEGWTWERWTSGIDGKRWWCATRKVGEKYQTVQVPDTGNEIADRYALALEARKAIEGSQR